MSELHSADLVILILILLSAVIGLVRGLIREALSLVVWFTAFVLGILFADQLAAHFQMPWTEDMSPTGRSMVNHAAAFGAIFIGVLVVGGIAQWALHKLIEITHLSGTDRLLGFVFGSIRGAIVVIVALVAVEPFQSETDWWNASVLRGYLMTFEGEVVSLFGTVSEVVQQVGI